MKKKLSLILIICLFQNLHLLAKNEPLDTLYWYKVNFEIVRDSIDFRPFYKIVQVYPDVISGTQQDYLKFQKDNMQKGFIAIGPFKEQESVAFSQHYYANINMVFALHEETIPGNYYWYSAEVQKIKIDNGFDFTGTSKWINNGNTTNFKQDLFNGLECFHLLIGPFPNQISAENSKSLNSAIVPKKIAKKTFKFSKYNQSKYVDYETLYWFSLKLETKRDSDWHYVISEVKPEIFWGTSRKYVESQKEQMKSGFVCVGPYEDMQWAINANSYYKDYKDIESTYDTFIDTTGYSEYFFYDSEIKTLKKNGNKEFSRVPARVSEGCTLLEFRQSLFVGLEICHFLIGPFLTQLNAEESKRLNRMLEPRNSKKHNNIIE